MNTLIATKTVFQLLKSSAEVTIILTIKKLEDIVVRYSKLSELKMQGMYANQCCEQGRTVQEVVAITIM